MAALGRHEGYFSTANTGTFVRTCVRRQRDMHPLGLTKVFRQETFSIWKWKFSANLLSRLRSITGRGTVCCRSFLLKRVLPLLLLLTGNCSLLHLQGELLNLNILELEYVTEQEQSGKCFDIPTQHERVRGLKLFPFTSISSCWVLVWGALAGAKGPIVFWSVCLVLEKLPVVSGRCLSLVIPDFWKLCFCDFVHLTSS